MDINNLSLTMGKRLKEEREKCGLSHEKLRAALLEKYGVEISKDSLINYEVSDENHTKKYKNNGMRVEYLRYFADFYGVSADWLLGLSEESTVDSDIRKVCQYTGLSSGTIEFLHNLHDSRKRNFFKRLFSEFSDEWLEEIPESIFEAAKAHIIAKNEVEYDGDKQNAVSHGGLGYTLAPEHAEEFYLYRAQTMLQRSVEFVIEQLLLECEDECKELVDIDSFEWAVADEDDENGRIPWNV